jgi:hypothetical protein
MGGGYIAECYIPNKRIMELLALIIFGINLATDLFMPQV